MSGEDLEGSGSGVAEGSTITGSGIGSGKVTGSGTVEGSRVEGSRVSLGGASGSAEG